MTSKDGQMLDVESIGVRLMAVHMPRPLGLSYLIVSGFKNRPPRRSAKLSLVPHGKTKSIHQLLSRDDQSRRRELRLHSRNQVKEAMEESRQDAVVEELESDAQFDKNMATAIRRSLAPEIAGEEETKSCEPSVQEE